MHVDEGGNDRTFLFAGSLQHAKTSAEIDYNWRTIAKFYFRDHEGEPVIAIRDAQALYGQPVKILYVGWGARDNREYREVLDLAAVLNAEVRHHLDTIKLSNEVAK